MFQLFASKKDSLNLDLMNVSDHESSPLEELENMVKKLPEKPAPQTVSRLPSLWRLPCAFRPYVSKISPRDITRNYELTFRTPQELQKL